MLSLFSMGDIVLEQDVFDMAIQLKYSSLCVDDLGIALRGFSNIISLAKVD